MIYNDPSGELGLECGLILLVKFLFVASAAVGAYNIINSYTANSGGGSNNEQVAPAPSSNSTTTESTSTMSQPHKGKRVTRNLDWATYNLNNNSGEYIKPNLSSMYRSTEGPFGVSLTGSRDLSPGLSALDFIPDSGLGNSSFGIKAEDVLDTTLDFVPIAGGIKDIYKGIRDGDGWQVAMGAGSLVLDVLTLGSASLVKGAVKTGIKAGSRYLAKSTARASTSFARLSSNGARLNQHLTQLEKYGSGGFKTLQNGRFRYYGKTTLNRGDANSFRMVREWNPATGGKRTWFETLNPNGGVIQVRPEFGTGVKTHYLFNGSGGYLGKW